MKNLFKILALLFTMGLFVTACDDVKLDEDTNTEDIEIAEDNALAAGKVRDIFAAVNDGTNPGGKVLAACPEFTYDPETKILTLNYGTGCPGDDLITRKGMITAVFSGVERGWETDETVTISFTDYYSDDIKLEGSMTITCNDVVTPSFTIVAENMVLTFPGGQTIKWSSNETITLYQTDQTGEYWRFNGGTTGTCTARSGKTFSRTSTNLLSSPTCEWFIDGSLTMTVGDNVTIVTFLNTCGKIRIKRNNLPEFEVTL